MLPRRAFQLLLCRVTLPVPHAAAFATASAARLGKTASSSSGLALEAAVKKVQESAVAKFDETVDVAVNLNIDGTKSDQNVRGQVNDVLSKDRSRPTSSLTF
jgi:ribosomal protein L1